MKITATGDNIKRAILSAQSDLREARSDWQTAVTESLANEEEIYEKCCELEGTIVDLQELQSANNLVVEVDGISLGVFVRLVGVHRRMCATMTEFMMNGGQRVSDTKATHIYEDRIRSHKAQMAEHTATMHELNKVESTIEIEYVEYPEVVQRYLERSKND